MKRSVLPAWLLAAPAQAEVRPSAVLFLAGPGASLRISARDAIEPLVGTMAGEPSHPETLAAGSGSATVRAARKLVGMRGGCRLFPF